MSVMTTGAGGDDTSALLRILMFVFNCSCSSHERESCCQLSVTRCCYCLLRLIIATRDVSLGAWHAQKLRDASGRLNFTQDSPNTKETFLRLVDAGEANSECVLRIISCRLFSCRRKVSNLRSFFFFLRQVHILNEVR